MSWGCGMYRVLSVAVSKLAGRVSQVDRFRLALFLGLGLATTATSAAQALTLKPIYDTSITSQANAAIIESAFNAVAKQFDNAFANPATVNIVVSWGSAGYQALPSGDIGASVTNLSGPYTFAAVSSPLAKSGFHLPTTDPTHLNAFEVPYSETKAFGWVSPTRAAVDGYVGFSNVVNYDFAPVGGITAGTYDFAAVAAHEIEEVLGRTTGLNTSHPGWATPFDLFRYAAPGASSFSTSNAAYFSVDGGKTNLGGFNVAGGGDRNDWASTISGDLGLAYFATGKPYVLSKSDLTALDAIGWGAFSSGALTTGPVGSDVLSTVSAVQAAVPEPDSWLLMIGGIGICGAALRAQRRRRPLSPAA